VRKKQKQDMHWSHFIPFRDNETHLTLETNSTNL